MIIQDRRRPAGGVLCVVAFAWGVESWEGWRSEDVGGGAGPQVLLYGARAERRSLVQVERGGGALFSVVR